MILKRKKTQPKANIPTASMGDIAFLLIIFFMVSTTFSNEMGLQIVLPEKGEEVKVKSKNIVHLYVDADGSLRLEAEPFPVEELTQKVEDLLAENDSLIFSIKTHPDCPYQLMMNVFDKLKLAEATRISFVPLKRK